MLFWGSLTPARQCKAYMLILMSQHPLRSSEARLPGLSSNCLVAWVRPALLADQVCEETDQLQVRGWSHVCPSSQASVEGFSCRSKRLPEGFSKSLRWLEAGDYMVGKNGGATVTNSYNVHLPSTIMSSHHQSSAKPRR